MGINTMAAEVFRTIEGIFLAKHFPDDAVRSTLAYKPRPGDLFIVSYPKCGTTWTQYIVYNILTDAEGPKDDLELLLRLPFLEMQGGEAAAYAPRPAAFKTHLPFDKNPYSLEAKYIYITRNPYDCCVSFYYHTRNMPPYLFEHGTFDDFFELFLRGRVDFGDYFENVLSWYAHRNDPNVLFLTYEELKRDTVSGVLRIAAFIGEEKHSKIKENPELLSKILDRCSLQHMKKDVNDGGETLESELKNLPQLKTLKPELLRGVQNFIEFTKKPMTGEFIRKGQVGDWKNHFSSEQIRRMKEKIAEATKGSDLMSLWKDVDIPRMNPN
ncbi:sulfotransferase ssu-1 isoform X1 [Dermacentor silvarum]|uniref:sulfotransferase ssu-1 isoform X1 n=2 Tax=Dermacentor silvarum TaxID=543639 RepID=UPI002100DCAC|nr:sulfotransferase ssu-1 isoform X1 [Dermacentor silvarum]